MMLCGGVSPPVMIIVNADCFGGAPGFLVSTVVSQPACKNGCRVVSRASSVFETGSLESSSERRSRNEASSRGEIRTSRGLDPGPDPEDREF